MFLCYGVCGGGCSQRGAFWGSQGGDARGDHKVGAECSAGQWGQGGVTAGLLSLLLRTEVAAGTGLPDPVARGVSMVGLEPPDAVFSGLKPSSSILGALGPGGETEALSHQDRCTPCPTVLISRTFRHVSSNSQTTTNPASPERCPPHNPNPCRPPKTSSLCLVGVLQEKTSSPTAATVGSPEPEPAVPGVPTLCP